MWRKGKFKLAENHDLLLNFDKYNSLFKSTQICPIAVLRLLENQDEKSKNGTYFIVASAHINYNTERGDKKLAQVYLIVQAIQKIKEFLMKCGNKVNIILCGDFNSTPSSGVYKLLTTGKYDCSLLSLQNISGQLDCMMPEKPTEKWYKDTINKCSKLCNDAKKPGEIVERLQLWYMTIKNVYMEYDIMRRNLTAKYKIELPSIFSIYERKSALAIPEKRRVRELFCNSMEEIEKLENSELNKTQELFSYILELPSCFKNAYSEVFKYLISYIKEQISKKSSKSSIYYLPLETIDQLKAKIGDEFYNINLNYENFEETEKQLIGHSYESPYSHWVDRMLKCDYILYEGKGMVPVKVYEIPDYRKITALGNICPNESVPSDHLPIATLFYYDPNN